MKKTLPYILLAIAVIYDINPADFVPDAIPGAGWIDDIIVTVAAVANLIRKRKKDSEDPS